MLFSFRDSCAETKRDKKDWALSCRLQVIADRLFSLAQRDQATPVVKVFCFDVQLCRHARMQILRNKKTYTRTHTRK